METAHQDTGQYRETGFAGGWEHKLGHWSDLPPDLRIVIPLMAIGHLIALASFLRLIFVRQGLGLREELGE